ncbi:MAG: polysaccharide deacetylase family protein [Solirubrobacteraceae bacterium]
MHRPDPLPRVLAPGPAPLARPPGPQPSSPAPRSSSSSPVRLSPSPPSRPLARSTAPRLPLAPRPGPFGLQAHSRRKRHAASSRRDAAAAARPSSSTGTRQEDRRADLRRRAERLHRRRHSHPRLREAFFVLGNEIPGRERLLQRMLGWGFEIGDHSYSHPQFPSNGQLSITRDRIRKATGFTLACSAALRRRQPRPHRARPGAGHDDHQLGRRPTRLVDPGSKVSWVTAPKRRAMQLLIRVRGGLAVGYLDGDGLVWAVGSAKRGCR